MRNAMPLQWIEQAEARRVVASMLLEQTPQRSGRAAAPNRRPGWLTRLAGWCSAETLNGYLMLQAQPVLVPVRRAAPRRIDAGGYHCDRKFWLRLGSF